MTDYREILRLHSLYYSQRQIAASIHGSRKTYLACAIGNAACRKFKSDRYIRMPELLDELSVAKRGGGFKRAIKPYRKMELLVLDEWFIRCLTSDESYDSLEIVEAWCSHGSMIFRTQYEKAEWQVIC